MTDTNIKVLSTKSLAKSTFINLREVTLLLGNGEKRVHRTAERLPTVTILPLTDTYDVYLMKQYRYLLNKTVLAAASGFMDKIGETPLQTAKRELKEELGITAHQWESLAKVDLASSVFKGDCYIFLAKDLELGEQSLEDDEEITPVKLSLAEAAEKVMNGEITSSITMIGILMLDKLRREKKL